MLLFSEVFKSVGLVMKVLMNEDVKRLTFTEDI